MTPEERARTVFTHYPHDLRALQDAVALVIEAALAQRDRECHRYFESPTGIERKAIDLAVEEEREACAKVADKFSYNLAAAIRARSTSE